MKCPACGDETPRLRLTQRYCPDCERRIESTVRRDDERRRARWTSAKVLSGGSPR